MRPSEAFGEFGCIPSKLDPAWISQISLHARLIGQILISMCKDPGDLSLSVSADWKDALCVLLLVKGTDRRNAKAALQQLVDHGFLTVEQGRVRVNLVPVLAPDGSKVDPKWIQPDVSFDSKSTQVIENTQLTFDRIDIEKRRVKEEEHVRAREAESKANVAPQPEPANNQVGRCEVQDVRRQPSIASVAESERQAASRAAVRLQAFGFQFLPVGEWVEPLLELSRRPDAEWVIADSAIRAAIARGDMNFMTPSSIARNWHRYSKGQLPVTAADVKREREANRPATQKPQERPEPAYLQPFKFADGAGS